MIPAAVAAEADRIDSEAESPDTLTDTLGQAAEAVLMGADEDRPAALATVAAAALVALHRDEPIHGPDVTPLYPALRHAIGHTVARPGVCINFDRVGNLALFWVGYDGRGNAIDEIPAAVVDLIVKAYADHAGGGAPRIDLGTAPDRRLTGHEIPLPGT